MADFDSAEAMARSEAKGLAAFLQAGAEQGRLWRPEEVAAIYRHQMTAPILIDLGRVRPIGGRAAAELERRAEFIAAEFRRFVPAPGAAPGIIGADKGFCEGEHGPTGSVLPGEVAGALYYESIAGRPGAPGSPHLAFERRGFAARFFCGRAPVHGWTSGPGNCWRRRRGRFPAAATKHHEQRTTVRIDSAGVLVCGTGRGVGQSTNAGAAGAAGVAGPRSASTRSCACWAGAGWGWCCWRGTRRAARAWRSR